MRAAVITAFNADWELKDLPDPRPGPGQVVIRIRASGMRVLEPEGVRALPELPVRAAVALPERSELDDDGRRGF